MFTICAITIVVDHWWSVCCATAAAKRPDKGACDLRSRY